MCSNQTFRNFKDEISDQLITFLQITLDDTDVTETELRRMWIAGATPEQAYRRIEQMILEQAITFRDFDYCKPVPTCPECGAEMAPAPSEIEGEIKWICIC